MPTILIPQRPSDVAIGVNLKMQNVMNLLHLSLLQSIQKRLGITGGVIKDLRVVVVALLLCAGQLLGQEDSQTASRVGISSAIVTKFDQFQKQLDSNKLNERDLAELRIIELGPSVIELLPPVSDSDSEELQMRYERIRIALSKKDQVALTTPSMVSLQGRLTGRQAIDSIIAQTGNAIEAGPFPQLDQSYDFAIQSLTFWEAIDIVLDQLDLSLVYGDGQSLAVIPQAESTPARIDAAGYCGAFRIEPIFVSKNSDLHQPKESSLAVRFQLAWEPRLAPSLIRFPAGGVVLECDDGQQLSPRQASEVEFSPTGGSQLIFDLNFQLPSRNASRISKCRGVVTATLPGKMASVAFTDIEKTTNKTLVNGMLQVTLEKARKNRDIFEVLVGVSLKADEEKKDSVQAWSSLQEVFMFDKEMKRVDNVGWSTTRINENDIGMSYLFELEDGLKGYKFVFRAPGTLNEHEIEFEIEDIPLP